MKNRIVIALLTPVIFISAIICAVYATNNAVDHKVVYEKKLASYQVYEKISEGAENSKFDLPFITQVTSEKAEEIKKLVDSEKSQLIRYSALASTMYLIALLMILCFVLNYMSIVKASKKKE